MVKGEAIYKTSERIVKYGIKAYIKQLNPAVKAHRTYKEWVKYYTTKYPKALLEIVPSRPEISRTQKSYWRDVKALSKARGLRDKDSRGILKKLKTKSNIQVRVIKEGGGWQLILLGLYERHEKEGEKLKPPYETKEQEGWSYLHNRREQTDVEEMEEEAQAEAIIVLGGTGWVLVKVIKRTWIRYIGAKQ